jgi:hypothetical protein
MCLPGGGLRQKEESGPEAGLPKSLHYLSLIDWAKRNREHSLWGTTKQMAIFRLACELKGAVRSEGGEWPKKGTCVMLARKGV